MKILLCILVYLIVMALILFFNYACHKNDKE